MESSSPTKAEVEKWLDRSYISDIEEGSDPNAQYIYAVEIGAWVVNVFRAMGEDKLQLRSEGTFDAEVLTTLLSHDRMRRNFRVQLASVLTNAPGFYQYLGDDGEICQFDEMRTLALEYPIYPDKLSEHSVMEGIIQIAESLKYIQETIDVSMIEIDDTR